MKAVKERKALMKQIRSGLNFSQRTREVFLEKWSKGRPGKRNKDFIKGKKWNDKYFRHGVM